jgi:hypothetical protein
VQGGRRLSENRGEYWAGRRKLREKGGKCIKRSAKKIDRETRRRLSEEREEDWARSEKKFERGEKRRVS